MSLRFGPPALSYPDKGFLFLYNVAASSWQQRNQHKPYFHYLSSTAVMHLTTRRFDTMAFSNSITASSSPLARTDTPQPLLPQPPAPAPQPPTLHTVAPGVSALPVASVSNDRIDVDQAPQFQPRLIPNSPHSRLRASARDGDSTAIKRLLATDKPDIAATDPATGMTSLMLAASAGHDYVVFLLCKNMQTQDITAKPFWATRRCRWPQRLAMPMWSASC